MVHQASPSPSFAPRHRWARAPRRGGTRRTLTPGNPLQLRGVVRLRHCDVDENAATPNHDGYRVLEEAVVGQDQPKGVLQSASVSGSGGGGGGGRALWDRIDEASHLHFARFLGLGFLALTHTQAHCVCIYGCPAKSPGITAGWAFILNGPKHVSCAGLLTVCYQYGPAQLSSGVTSHKLQNWEKTVSSYAKLRDLARSKPLVQYTHGFK